MTTLICNDLVINEDSCNLSCRYCLTGQSTLKTAHLDKLIFGPPRRDCCRSGTPLRERLTRIVSRFRTQFDAPLLKITGGEVYLIDGIEEFIAECSALFETVIVQTNGVLLSDTQLDQLEALENVVLQISLDCHHFEGNSYRVGSASQHRKVMERLQRIFSRRIPIEVYSVVTDQNIDHLPDFADWLALQRSRPQLFFFPVRGPDARQFAPDPSKIGTLRAFVESPQRAAPVRPPQAYLERLLRFYAEGGRRFCCHLPRMAASTFSDGTLTPCPNIWFSDAGDYSGEAWQSVGQRMVESGIRRALLAPAPRLDACKGCYTPWDVLSLYIDGHLTIDDICSTPTYRAPEIRKRLLDARAGLDCREAEVAHFGR